MQASGVLCKRGIFHACEMSLYLIFVIFLFARRHLWKNQYIEYSNLSLNKSPKNTNMQFLLYIRKLQVANLATSIHKACTNFIIISLSSKIHFLSWLVFAEDNDWLQKCKAAKTPPRVTMHPKRINYGCSPINVTEKSNKSDQKSLAIKFKCHFLQ
jgi:hypothetical protein